MPGKDKSHLWASEDPLDRHPLSIALPIGLRDRLRKIPNWQPQIRELLHQFVIESESMPSYSAWAAGASHLPASGGVRGMRVSERLHPPARRKGAASGRWADV